MAQASGKDEKSPGLRAGSYIVASTAAPGTVQGGDRKGRVMTGYKSSHSNLRQPSSVTKQETEDLMLNGSVPSAGRNPYYTATGTASSQGNKIGILEQMRSQSQVSRSYNQKKLEKPSTATMEDKQR